MELEERKKIYRHALDKWGNDAQMHMVFEECGELMSALAKVYRNRSTAEDVLTELADVSIMVEQMATMINYDAYEKEKERKLVRLKERLDGHKDKS